MKPNILTNAALAAFATLALAACDRAQTEQAKREAGEAGRKIESALERTGDKIADATRKATAEVKDGPSAETKRSLSDAAITASIKTDYLKDPDLSVLKIDVDTKDGVVVLNGMAGSEDGKQRAEKIASAIKGVREVRNHLTVKQG